MLKHNSFRKLRKDPCLVLLYSLQTTSSFGKSPLSIDSAHLIRKTSNEMRSTFHRAACQEHKNKFEGHFDTSSNWRVIEFLHNQDLFLGLQ